MFLRLKRNILFLKYSKLILKLLFILWNIGIIDYFNINKKKKIIKIYLNNSLNSSFKKISKVKFYSNKKFKLVVFSKKFNFRNFFFLVFVKNNLFLLKDFLIQKKKKGLIFCKFY